MSSYTAICERAGKWWEITVPELPSGSVTQARRLDQVPETVRSLVHLMTGADAGEIRMEIRMPEGMRIEVARARQLREKAEAEARESAALSRDAARRLAADGLPVRDIGEILGVSHQRAHQFLAAKQGDQVTATSRNYEVRGKHWEHGPGDDVLTPEERQIIQDYAGMVRRRQEESRRREA